MIGKYNMSGYLLLMGLLCVSQVFSGRVMAQQQSLQSYYDRVPFKMNAVVEPQFADRTFNIVNYGAVPGGKVLNTKAFADAIQACANAGGGKVIVPAGVWLTGPIQLLSNLNLEIQKDGLVQFTTDHTQYPFIKASTKSSTLVPASPVYGYDLKNVAITGEGILDGAGESWRPVKKGKTTATQWDSLVTSGGVVSKDGKIWWPSQQAMDGEAFLKDLKKSNPKPTAEALLPARDYLRPYMVYLMNCENVLLQGVTIRNSPKFVFYPNSCNNLTMRKVTIFNEWWAQNGDGIDISACKNVVIYNCLVNAGDDGICMKSSTKKDETGPALENVLIAGCTVLRAHGGFVIGSNTDGGMEHIYVADCNFIGSDIGIRVKSNKGRGGLVKDIYIDGITMKNIKEEAILFDTHYDDVPAGKEKADAKEEQTDKVPEFRDFFISNVTCEGAKKAIAITGLEEMPVSKINFKNVTITSDEGYVNQYADDIKFKDVKIITSADVQKL